MLCGYAAVIVHLARPVSIRQDMETVLWGCFTDETNLKAGCPTAIGWNEVALI